MIFLLKVSGCLLSGHAKRARRIEKKSSILEGFAIGRQNANPHEDDLTFELDHREAK